MGQSSSQQERLLIEAIVSRQAGIDSHRLGSVVDLAAVGIVLHVWRNSPVEDWHAGSSPLHDGDMLRINAHTTWKVRQILRRWVADTGLDGDGPTDQLETVEHELVDELFPRLFEWMVNPARRLPTGQTLAELAMANHGELAEFEDHADREVGAYCAVTEQDGAVVCFWRAAAAGGVACRHWWGTPTWPQLVERFLHVLQKPDHEHWGSGGELRTRLGPEPPQVADRAVLDRTLRERPWHLDTPAADWVIRAGIGFLREPVPPLPDHLI